MKRFISLALIGFFFLFMLNSCQEEPATQEEADIIENISGDWTAHMENPEIGDEMVYVVSIKQVGDTKDLTLDNFINNSETANATLNGQTIDVPLQTLGNYEVEGTGVISADMTKITWNLTIDGQDVSGYFEPGTITKK